MNLGLIRPNTPLRLWGQFQSSYASAGLRGVSEKTPSRQFVNRGFSPFIESRRDLFSHTAYTLFTRE